MSSSLNTRCLSGLCCPSALLLRAAICSFLSPEQELPLFAFLLPKSWTSVFLLITTNVLRALCSLLCAELRAVVCHLVLPLLPSASPSSAGPAGQGRGGGCVWWPRGCSSSPKTQRSGRCLPAPPGTEAREKHSLIGSLLAFPTPGSLAEAALPDAGSAPALSKHGATETTMRKNFFALRVTEH